jgi:hypothetical protein
MSGGNFEGPATVYIGDLSKLRKRGRMVHATGSGTDRVSPIEIFRANTEAAVLFLAEIDAAEAAKVLPFGRRKEG